MQGFIRFRSLGDTTTDAGALHPALNIVGIHDSGRQSSAVDACSSPHLKSSSLPGRKATRWTAKRMLRGPHVMKFHVSGAFQPVFSAQQDPHVVSTTGE